MGYVFNYNDAVSYEKWQSATEQDDLCHLTHRLILDMLRPVSGESLLDIGCGPGRVLSALRDHGLKVTGIDPSPFMVDLCRTRMEQKADVHIGSAEDLPFDDNSFNYALLVHTLEFAAHPRKALEEACRVAKDRVFLCFLNRLAVHCMDRHMKGWEVAQAYEHARLFTLWEVKEMLACILGDVPIAWRAASPGSVDRGGLMSRLLQRLPFGMLIAMAVAPVPRFRTRPICMEITAKNRAAGPVAG